MKSKIEKKLDGEFEKFGVKPKIYHFTVDDIPCLPFKAVSVITIDGRSWKRLYEIIEESSRFLLKCTHSYATEMISMLQEKNIYGVAICDPRDQFNRKYGRIKAKGRLLQYLKSC